MSSTAFASIPITPRNHFRVNFHAAVFHLAAHIRSLGEAGAPEPDAAFERHPFLSGYLNAMSGYLPKQLRWDRASSWWEANIRSWEEHASVHLPLAALDGIGLSFPERLALVLAGLVEEDARFGSVFAELQRPLEPRRPTLGTITALVGGHTDAWSLRTALVPRGLLDAAEGDGPRSEETVRVPVEVWSILRGTPDRQPLAWAEAYGVEELDPLADLVVACELRARLEQLPRLLAAEPAHVVLRGPSSSGRRRLLGALAKSVGKGALFVDADRLDPATWRRLGALCTALGAMPVVRYRLLVGETAAVPELVGYHGPVGVVVGSEGGLEGRSVETAVRLDVPRAGADERRRHWHAACGDVEVDDPDTVAERFHLPAGHIRRVARAAIADATLKGNTSLAVADIATAAQTLSRQRLDTLAQRLDPLHDWGRLIVDDATHQRLVGLEHRCRHRERVLNHLGSGFDGAANVGVRVLLTGPSGTGKTLAARILAAELDMDVYRVDLAAVINKYVGETEKNLHRILATAEELDVVLLIDEGDSLLGNRTEVRTANDRFANLETNYLLQRLESYQGIVLVTTNAADHIDAAFQRRMDVVLAFVEPGPAERWQIWDLHLPPDHQVDADYLDELSVRAEMTGGQVRNAAMQAALAALDERCPVATRHVARAVAIEYGKAGAVSPFQHTTTGARQRRSDAFFEALP